MPDYFNLICQYADYAPYIFLGLLFLAGLSIPISEDLILLTAGALVSRCIPDQYAHLYFWVFLGCWISGWEAYWMGRLLGPKLYKYRWFHHIINPDRIERLQHFYERFGIFTFIVGRFIPGGVRNALFLTAGMGKMPFLLFTMRDLVAVFISSSTIFYLGFLFGENYETIAATMIRYNRIAFIIIALIVLFVLYRLFKKAKLKSNSPDDHST